MSTPSFFVHDVQDPVLHLGDVVLEGIIGILIGMSAWVTKKFGLSMHLSSSMFSMQRFICAQASTPQMPSRKL